jgi:hypothetical protein
MSRKAIASGRKLQRKVGNDHVRVIAVRGIPLPDNKVRIVRKEIPLGLCRKLTVVERETKERVE